MRVYQWQTSKIWESLMGLLSFIYMYLIIFEKGEYRAVFRVMSPVLYCIFLVDFVMQTYHEYYD